MHKCLIEICQEFETVKDFLTDSTKEKEEIINALFLDFMECFPSIKEEKLDYPKEFIHDIVLFNEGNFMLVKKFQDVQMKYLILSDFYDYARLRKKYKVIKK
ncbi:hypothetical protein KKG81_10345 [bacterium]|jgi:hypothetical protein|nr:hypothetical protein [bacterium]